MGMRLKVVLPGGVPHFPTPDADALTVLAVRARVFTLKTEQIQFEKVHASLRRFAEGGPWQRMVDQLVRLREDCGRPRLYFYAADLETGDELIRDGTDSQAIGDRFLYSQIVHADDESDLLGHIDTDMQLWSLAGLVGDWVALIAHQEWLIHKVRPDLCPQPTGWAGDQKTIFRRLGGQIFEAGGLEEGPGRAEPREAERAGESPRVSWRLG